MYMERFLKKMLDILLNFDGYLNECDTEIIRKDLTFLRVVIDSICIENMDEWIAETVRSGAIFGFVMEYQISTFEPSCKPLKDRFKANAKNYSNKVITFNHKRVFKMDPNNKLWNLWKSQYAKFWLYLQLNVPGKFSKKQLAYCEVPLFQLLYVPFGVSRSFMIVGKGFTGSILLRIELGSHIKSLMERLDIIRNSVSGAIYQRRNQKSYNVQSTEFNNRIKEQRHLQSNCFCPSNLSPVQNSPSTSTADVHLMSPQPDSYTVTLTVHSARRLPVATDSWNPAPPATYVSVVANSNRVLCSQVCKSSYEPEFNWSEKFQISKKRRNLVVKLWQKLAYADQVLGFVSIPLPPMYAGRTEYEMSNLMTALETPFISISLDIVREDESQDVNGEVGGAQALITPSNKSSTAESPSIRLSREELSEKLKKNLNELQMLLEELRT
uniref:C2 domain-containing protein n=1 Tax=Syphacia muris TaxID=451379 RepID=A0A0N5A864_9BILA